MKLLLLNPPQTYNSGEEPIISFPLGLGYLASVLVKNDYKVEVLDALVEGYDKKTRKGNRYIAGLTIKNLIQRIEHIKPDIILISYSFSVQYAVIEEIIQIIKKINPKIITILGGNHPSSQAKELLLNPNIDFIVAGEGEHIILKLLEDIRNKKFNKKYYKTDLIKNLDALPFPARHLFPIKSYIKANKPHSFFRKKQNIASIITSRGCPYHCIFCASHQVHGRIWRGRSVKNIMSEIKHLKQSYGIEELHFEDDNFAFDRRRMIKLCTELIDDLIVWTAPNGIRSDTLDEELITLFKKSGCYALFLSFESGSQTVLDTKFKKSLSLEYSKKIVRWIKKQKIYLIGFFLIGAPEETEEEVRKTIDFASSLDLDEAFFSIITPYPGSELFEKYKPQIRNYIYMTPKNANLENKKITKEKIEYLRNLAYLKFESKKILKHPHAYFSLQQLNRLWRYIKYYLFQKLLINKNR